MIQTAWEDPAHVLAVVYERGRWSIVRLGVDGSAELAPDPVAASDLERPFVLAEGYPGLLARLWRFPSARRGPDVP